MKLLLATAAAALIAQGAAGQTAAERVEAIKEWKANCTSEDPDIQLAYMEAAVTGEGPAIARMCANAALTSDQPSARSMGLSAALAMTDSLTIPFDLPVEYQQQLAAAGDDEDKLAEVEERWEGATEILSALGRSVTLKKRKMAFGAGSSEWLTMSAGGYYDEDYQMDIQVSSEGLKGGGKMNSWGRVSFNLVLGDDGSLTGEMFIYKSGPFPVVMKII